MLIFEKRPAIILCGWLRAPIVLLISPALCVGLRAQEASTSPPIALPNEPSSVQLLDQTVLLPVSGEKLPVARLHETSPAAGLPVGGSNSASSIAGSRRITLEQAQQAASAANPMAHIAQLQVEAARQHRLGTESDYFLKIGSTLSNIHFNKFMGQEITIERPIAGGTVTAGLPLAGKDLTLVAVTAVQPVTPLFKLREVVKIARADERLAMAKAGIPVETASDVETAYYGLLVAQQQFKVSKENADKDLNGRKMSALKRASIRIAG
jgi:outer membrane protein TolC